MIARFHCAEQASGSGAMEPTDGAGMASGRGAGLPGHADRPLDNSAGDVRLQLPGLK